jgi:hypothetical protein
MSEQYQMPVFDAMASLSSTSGTGRGCSEERKALRTLASGSRSGFDM